MKALEMRLMGDRAMAECRIRGSPASESVVTIKNIILLHAENRGAPTKFPPNCSRLTFFERSGEATPYRDRGDGIRM